MDQDFKKPDVDLIADPETFSYKNQLPHQLQLLCNQMEAGLQVVRRVFRFLGKVSKSSIQYGQELADHLVQEAGKSPRKNKPTDAHFEYTQCHNNMQVYIQELGTKNREFGESLHNEIVEPLTKFHTEYEKKRIEYTKTINNKQKELENQMKETINLHKDATKYWKDLVETEKEYQKLNPEEKKEMVGIFKKQEKGIILEEKKQNLKEKAIEAFGKFESRSPGVQENYQSWFSQDFPKWLDEMQIFENTRLDILKESFLNFQKICVQYNQPSIWPEEFIKKTEPLDSITIIANQVMQWVFERGMPPVPVFPPSILPCNSNDLVNDNWLNYTNEPIDMEYSSLKQTKLGL